MKKSEKMMAKIRQIQTLLEQADALQQEFFEMVEEDAQDQCFDLHCGIENLIDDLDEIAYQFVMPIQVKEDSREFVGTHNG